MAKRPLEIDMCSSSQLRDTQGEMLNVEGADIAELEAGRGRLNDNHGKGFFNCLGKVTAAKKIFKAEDCEDDRQRYYWEKVKSPYIYVKGVLFDDEDHPNAKAAAAILRNIHKTDCPLKVKASVEGGVVSRGISDPALLARTKIHSVALTFVPANQATLVEPLNLDKSETDVEADMILIKSVLHLAEANVPSFRHITRDASAEKIENNLNEIFQALGSEDALSLKKALIEDSLESKIADNVRQIYQLVKAVSQQDEGAAAWIGGGGSHSDRDSIKPFAGQEKANALSKLSELTPTRMTQDGKREFLLHRGMSGYEHQKHIDPKNGIINHDRTSSWTPDRNTAQGFARHYEQDDADRVKHYGTPEAIQRRIADLKEFGVHEDDINNQINDIKERIAAHPNAKAGQVASAWVHEDQIRHLPTFGSDDFDNEQEVIVEPDHNSAIHIEADNDMDKKELTHVAFGKALTAGYGGAGAPMGMTGGSVLQTESQELGPKRLTFIVCDHCGKEQVYGKFQVKCREPECGKAFSMAKLEKFFSLQKSKKNTPEEQAKIDDFLRRRVAGQSPHATMGTGTKGHLPPATEGTFHGQGATTSGKIVHKGVSFTNKQTGERGFASHPQQEQHHWSWDHKNKKWNHIRTSYGSPNRG